MPSQRLRHNRPCSKVHETVTLIRPFDSLQQQKKLWQKAFAHLCSYAFSCYDKVFCYQEMTTVISACIYLVSRRSEHDVLFFFLFIFLCLHFISTEFLLCSSISLAVCYLHLSLHGIHILECLTPLKQLIKISLITTFLPTKFNIQIATLASTPTIVSF